MREEKRDALRKGVWLFLAAVLLSALICAGMMALNASMPRAGGTVALDALDTPLERLGVMLTQMHAQEDGYAVSFTVEGGGAMLLIKCGWRQAVWLDGVQIKPAGESASPIPVEAGVLHTLHVSQGSRPTAYIGHSAQIQGFLRLLTGTMWATAAIYITALVYAISLYMGKRTERYLLYYCAYLAAMLLWMLMISMPVRAAWLTWAEGGMFALVAVVSVKLCQMLTHPVLPRCLAWIEDRRFLGFGAAVFVLRYVLPPLASRVLLIALFVLCEAVLAFAAAQKRRGALLMLATMVLLTGLRPQLMVFSDEPFIAMESSFFYMMRSRTRAYDLLLVLSAMLCVNREFVWQFAQKELLAQHLDELVRERTRKLEDAQRQRQSMMLNIFHDIRTPLFVMRGALETMQANPSSAQTMLPLMGERLSFVSELTGDLFLAAKLEEGKVMITCKRTDLSAVIAVQGEQAAQLAGREQVRLVVQIAPGLIVWGEPLRLAQIAQNLITNAIHYTPAGGHVSLSLTKEGEEAVLRVADSGKGIAPDDMQHIFDRYFHTTVQSKHESSGLGLTIARDLTALHHGTLSVKSELGKGTTFTARFPLLDAQAEDRPAPGAE